MTETSKQLDQVLDYLVSGKDLTKEIAKGEFEIANIRPLISTLKSQGHTIENRSTGRDPAIYYLISNGQAKPKKAPKPAKEETFPKMVRVTKQTNKAVKRLALEAELTEGELYLTAIDLGLLALNKKYKI